jgi:hypothetical protein
MVAKVKKHVKPTRDIRGSTRHIASIVDISLEAAHTILKYDLKMRKILRDRWIPHLLIVEQKRLGCKNALTIFAETVSKSQFMVFCKCRHCRRNIKVHFYEPKRKRNQKKISETNEESNFTCLI